MAAEEMTTAGALDVARHRSECSEEDVLEALGVLAARVRELEAQQGEPTGVEWGVGDPDDCATDEDVRAVDGPAQFSITDRHFGRALLMRDVWRGPWRPAS